MTELREAAFVVVGVVRDCSRCLAIEVARMRRALSGAKQVHFLLVESDSTDDTIEVLRSIRASTPCFSFVSLGSLDSMYPARTERIAACRNVYLDRIRQDPAYAATDYVVVVDWDGVNSLITSRAIESCWSRSDWDVCTANQRGYYYDIWALRHALWSPNDYEQAKKFLRSYGVGRYRSQIATVMSRMISISLDSPWIQVESAFGGLAIYKKSIIESCSYSGRLVTGHAICEHVPLHMQITGSGGRIFINPAMVNCGFVEHTSGVRGLAHLLFWLRASLADLRDVMCRTFVILGWSTNRSCRDECPD